MRFVLCLVVAMAGPAVFAQDGGVEWAPDATVRWYDDFSDGDISPLSNGIAFNVPNWPPFLPINVDASSGDLVVTVGQLEGAALLTLHSFDMAERIDQVFLDHWSIRSKLTVHSGTVAGVSVDGGSSRAGAWWTSRWHEIGRAEGEYLLVGWDDEHNASVGEIQIPFETQGHEMFLQLDAFGAAITSTLWLADDLGEWVQTESPIDLGDGFIWPGVIVQGPDADVTFQEIWMSDRPIPIPVPEPSSLALTSLAPLGLFAVRRRKNARR